MADRGSDRGVSEVVGFVLIFSMIMLSWTILQGVYVPQQNKAVEFKHNQQVQGQFQELRNAILTNAVAGTDQTVSIKLGATYPDRTFTRNLGYSGGGVGTVSYDSGDRFTVANATAVDTYGETDDYWNGSARTFPNKPLVYQPVYTFYTRAPNTFYDNTLAFNRFPNTNLTITEQALVDGRRITLISLVGNFTESGSDTASIDPEAVSVGTTRVSVRNESHPINITISTKLPRDKWNETLAAENVSNGGHVKSVKDTGDEQVSIVLEEGVTYDLQMAKIGVGNGVEDEPAKYITLVDRPSRSIENGTSHLIEVEVRDRYNNPVSGFQVNGTVENGDGSFTDTAITTDSQGVAVFNYTADFSLDAGNTTQADLNISIYDAKPARNQTWVNLSVKSSVSGGGSGGSGTDDINPSGNNTIKLDATGQSGNSVTITLNNTKSNSVTFARFRLSFFFQKNGDGPLKEIANTSIVFHASDESIPSGLINFDTNDIELSPGDNEIIFTFDTVNDGNAGFFVVTFEDTKGNRFTYFVGFD